MGAGGGRKISKAEVDVDVTTADRDWRPSVLATAHDAIITTDAEGRVVQFNEAAERLFGYSDDEACGNLIADLIIPPEHQGIYWEGMLRIVTGGASDPRLNRGIELNALKKDGTKFPVMITATRTLDPPLLLRGFFRDLSEEREAEARRSRSDRRVAQSEELTLQGTVVINLASAEISWSDEFFRLLAYEPGEVSPSLENLVARVHPDDRDEISGRFARIVEDPTRVGEDDLISLTRFLGDSGEVRVIRGFGRLESDDAGDPAWWVISVQDVTEAENIKRSLAAHDAVSQTLRDWGSFEEGAALLLDCLGTSLGFSLGSFWTRSEAKGPLVCRAFWSSPDEAGEEMERLTRPVAYRPGQGPPGRAWLAGAPLIAENLGSEGSSRINDVAAKFGMRSAVAFPAMGEDGPLAVASFYSRDRVVATEHLERTLASLGRELGRFLQHRQTDFGARSLSPREVEVLALAAEGNTGPKIAGALQVTPATVKSHFESIYEKLGVSDRAAAVARAIRSGLIK